MLLKGSSPDAPLTEKDTILTYDLNAADNFPGLQGTISSQLAIGDVNASLVFDTQKIQRRTADGAYAALSGVQWADTLPKLVQAKLVQSFENAHQLGSVSRSIEQLTPEYRLCWDTIRHAWKVYSARRIHPKLIGIGARACRRTSRLENLAGSAAIAHPLRVATIRHEAGDLQRRHVSGHSRLGTPSSRINSQTQCSSPSHTIRRASSRVGSASADNMDSGRTYCLR